MLDFINMSDNYLLVGIHGRRDQFGSGDSLGRKCWTEESRVTAYLPPSIHLCSHRTAEKNIRRDDGWSFSEIGQLSYRGLTRLLREHCGDGGNNAGPILHEYARAGN